MSSDYPKESHIPAYRGEGDTLDEAVSNAAHGAGRDLAADEGRWYEVSRIQAEVVGHNQWVRTYRVVITPTS